MGMKILRVSEEMLTQLFTVGSQIPPAGTLRVEVVAGLPPGATFDRVSDLVFYATNDIAFRYSHPDWPERPGLPLEEVRVELTAHREPAATVALREAAIARREDLRAARGRLEEALRRLYPDAPQGPDERQEAVKQFVDARTETTRRKAAYEAAAVALADAIE